MKISKKQLEVLDVIKDYIVKHNYPPTTREISQIVGHKSTSTTHGHLEKLKNQGMWIGRNLNPARYGF